MRKILTRVRCSGCNLPIEAVDIVSVDICNEVTHLSCKQTGLAIKAMGRFSEIEKEYPNFK